MTTRPVQFRLRHFRSAAPRQTESIHPPPRSSPHPATLLSASRSISRKLLLQLSDVDPQLPHALAYPLSIARYTRTCSSSLAITSRSHVRAVSCRVAVDASRDARTERAEASAATVTEISDHRPRHPHVKTWINTEHKPSDNRFRRPEPISTQRGNSQLGTISWIVSDIVNDYAESPVIMHIRRRFRIIVDHYA